MLTIFPGRHLGAPLLHNVAHMLEIGELLLPVRLLLSWVEMEFSNSEFVDYFMRFFFGGSGKLRCFRCHLNFMPNNFRTSTRDMFQGQAGSANRLRGWGGYYFNYHDNGMGIIIVCRVKCDFPGSSAPQEQMDPGN